MSDDLEYLRDEWKAWGRYMRSTPDGFSTTSVLHKIKTMGTGAGAGGKSRKDFAPTQGIPKELVWIHRVWMNEMGYDMSRVMLVYFAAPRSASFEDKAKALNMGKTKMYEWVSRGILMSKSYEPKERRDE